MHNESIYLIWFGYLGCSAGTIASTHIAIIYFDAPLMIAGKNTDALFS